MSIWVILRVGKYEVGMLKIRENTRFWPFLKIRQNTTKIRACFFVGPIKINIMSNMVSTHGPNSFMGVYDH